MANDSIKNIVIFGETGTGKSSLVNMILQREAALISDAAIGCTFQCSCYSDNNYKFYDTVGLSEGSGGKVKSTQAISALIKLLKSLMSGVNLLVFVIRKDRIKKTLEENYKLFVDTICMKEVPVILVVTHCDRKSDIEQWWKNNKKYFDDYGMRFNDCVSVCAIKADDEEEEIAAIYKKRYEASREALMKCIGNNVMEDGWKMKTLAEWFVTILKKIWNALSYIFFWPRLPLLPQLMDLLIKIGFGEREAIDLSNEIVATGDDA